MDGAGDRPEHRPFTGPHTPDHGKTDRAHRGMTIHSVDVEGPEPGPWASPLAQAAAVAEELRIGLVGAATIPALPARWLDGVPRLESPAAADFFRPLQKENPHAVYG